MQTRKRAKSVSFGKPKKEEVASNAIEKEEKVVAAPADEEATEKVEKEEVKETKESAAEHHEKHEPSEAAKKVMDDDEEAEEKVKDDKEEEETLELSDKPTTDESSSELSATPGPATASDDFITDTQPDKEESKAEDSKSEESSGLSAVPEPTLSTPVLEPEPKSEETSPSLESTAPQTSEELSATPPASAFSLQEGGGDSGDSGGGGKKRNFFVYFLVIALFSFILGIGAMAVIASGLIPGVSLPKELPFASQIPQIGSNPSPTAVPTQAAPPTVKPTEKPLDLKAFKISVLNGSGIRGKAADVQDSLETAGFEVSTTGNADKSTYTKTQISAKAAVDEAYLDKLKAELEKDFVVEVAAAPAPASQATDVVVTIGKDTAE